MRFYYSSHISLVLSLRALNTRPARQASLHTDGSLNLGLCVLHSAEMLRGAFNWIFAGFVIDIVLEWKPALLSFIDDQRILGWINMVPNDVIYLVRPLPPLRRPPPAVHPAVVLVIAIVAAAAVTAPGSPSPSASPWRQRGVA